MPSSATVSLAMATLTNIVVVGFAAMKTEVANGLIGVQGQFTTGWATIGTVQYLGGADDAGRRNLGSPLVDRSQCLHRAQLNRWGY